jgi:hypothetical protein
MIIRLFARDLELVKVDRNSEKLKTECIGRSVFAENKAYIDGNEGFNTALHEIFHFYIHRSGFEQTENVTKEMACDMFATCFEQLIFENGDGILLKIKEFAE